MLEVEKNKIKVRFSSKISKIKKFGDFLFCSVVYLEEIINAEIQKVRIINGVLKKSKNRENGSSDRWVDIGNINRIINGRIVSVFCEIGHRYFCLSIGRGRINKFIIINFSILRMLVSWSYLSPLIVLRLQEAQDLV